MSSLSCVDFFHKMFKFFMIRLVRMVCWLVSLPVNILPKKILFLSIFCLFFPKLGLFLIKTSFLVLQILIWLLVMFFNYFPEVSSFVYVAKTLVSFSSGVSSVGAFIYKMFQTGVPQGLCLMYLFTLFLVESVRFIFTYKYFFIFIGIGIIIGYYYFL